MRTQRNKAHASVELEHWLTLVVERAMIRGADEHEVVVESPDKAQGLTLAQCRKHLSQRQPTSGSGLASQRLVPVSLIEEYLELLEHSPMSELMKFIRKELARKIINAETVDIKRIRAASPPAPQGR